MFREFREKPKVTLEDLTRDAKIQMDAQAPEDGLRTYRKNVKSVLSELSRLHNELIGLANKPFYATGCKSYGNSAIFSLNYNNPLKVKCSMKDVGTDYQFRCLKLVKNAPSLEISKFPKITTDTKIFFSSSIKGIDPDKRKDAIDDALLFVGDIPDENGDVKLGVPTKKCTYDIPVKKSILPFIASRFLENYPELQGDLERTVREQFS